MSASHTDTDTCSLQAMHNHRANLQALLDDAGSDDGEAAKDIADDHKQDAAELLHSANPLIAADCKGIVTEDFASQFNLSTITQQMTLLTSQWMGEGTLQMRICKYAIGLFCRDLVCEIVAGTFRAIIDKTKARRDRILGWVRMSRNLNRIDHLLNPLSRIPASLETKIMARQEKRGQQDGTKRLDHTTSIHRERCMDRSNIPNSNRAPVNSQQCADQKEMKIIASFVNSGCAEIKHCAPTKNLPTQPLLERPAHGHDRDSPFQLTSPQTSPNTVQAQPERKKMPRNLAITFSTYMRGSGRPENKRKIVAPRASSMLAMRKNPGKSPLPNAESIQLSYNRPDCSNEGPRLPRVHSAKREKENLRSASAEPSNTLSAIPDILKVRYRENARQVAQHLNVTEFKTLFPVVPTVICCVLICFTEIVLKKPSAFSTAAEASSPTSQETPRK